MVWGSFLDDIVGVRLPLHVYPFYIRVHPKIHSCKGEAFDEVLCGEVQLV